MGNAALNKRALDLRFFQSAAKSHAAHSPKAAEGRVLLTNLNHTNGTFCIFGASQQHKREFFHQLFHVPHRMVETEGGRTRNWHARGQPRGPCS